MFNKCGDCWIGAGCDIRGRCLADEVLASVDSPLAGLTFDELSARINALKDEVDRRQAQLDKWANAAPSWVDLTPKPVFGSNGGCACCSFADADEEARAEGFEPLPFVDFLMGEDAPTADEMILDAVGDAVSAVVNMLLLQGIAPEELIARLAGATRVHSITVNVDGDVNDGNSIADAIRRGLN